MSSNHEDQNDEGGITPYQEATTAAAKVAGEAYDDAAAPILERFGSIGANLLAFVDLPLELAVERLEDFLDDVTAEIPDERRQEPHPAISRPIIDNALLLPENDPLREMFRRLLSRAMDSQRDDEAHPAYSRTILHMAPDEAHFLFRLSQSESPIILEYAKVKNDFDGELTELEEEKPGARFRSINDDLTNYKYGYKFDDFEWLDFPTNVPMYTDHLDSLGLIQSRPHFEHHKYLIDPETGDTKAEEQAIYFVFTTFGASFVESCLPSSPKKEWGW